MMVPPIRGGTPTVDSGARSPSAAAMRTSTAMSHAVSNAAIRARMGKGLSPVSMNGASAQQAGRFAAARARLENLAEGARPETCSEPPPRRDTSRHFSRHRSEVGALPKRETPKFSCSSTFPTGHVRSEEHTSELQLQSNLVCRLLLEKKKNIYKQDESADTVIIVHRRQFSRVRGND